MNHYQQSLVIEATPATVYAALTTPAGLRGWWSQDSDISTGVGSTLNFRFGPHHKSMRIELLESGREVHWLCITAHIDIGHFTHHDEWVGTQLQFHLTPIGANRTQLDFEHIGLVPSLECYDLCKNGWQHFMASLKQYAETGQGTPYVLNTECAASAAN